MAGPFAPTKDGVLVAVHVQPRASKAALGPIATDAAGASVLKARVTAAPADGRANAAVCALLAKALGVPKASVRIVRGATSRHKTVHVTGDPQALLARLAALAG
ncbi:MAG: DUF167 domain-containing protein [Alphaproteobacteria bacterium]|nr:DUF167 domain-containing protein [Alphaproteobacteria bacterium]